jgi:hypothetical protein
MHIPGGEGPALHCESAVHSGAGPPLSEVALPASFIALLASFIALLASAVAVVPASAVEPPTQPVPFSQRPPLAAQSVRRSSNTQRFCMSHAPVAVGWTKTSP